MKPRTLDSIMHAPTHANGMKPCLVMTAAAVHTISLPEGSFAAMVHDRPDLETGYIVVMDRAETEALITLLQNAIDDADRLDAGLPALTGSGSTTRQ